MIKETIATGKDVQEAQENARLALQATELDDVKFEIIYLGRKGFMGFGAKPAQVRAYIEIPEKEERRRRPERQKREKVERSNSPKPESNETKVENAAQAENAPKSDAQKSKKKKHKKPQREAREPQESKPKSQVIPECELKFERREVAEGEDMSYDFIRTVILDIGINATAELYSCDDGTRRITIKGEDAATLIGHHGDTLDALQYLANLASARKNINGERDKSRVTLDIEGYRAKREETLRALARRMAAKALRNKRSVMLEPMSAYERRIIHSEIQGIDGVSTNSIGSDNNRKIVIFLTDKRPKEIFEEEKKTPLTEEFATAEDDVSVQDVNVSVESDLASEDEALTVKQTYPDESENFADAIDDSDIK